MKRKFVTLTLTLCMLLLVATPAQVFAATKCNQANQAPINIVNCKITYQDYSKVNCSIPTKPTTPTTPTTPTKPTAPTTPETSDNSNAALGSYQQQVVDLVNKERAAAGLKALTVNTSLSKVAEKKAEDMRDNNYFSHTSPTYGSPFDMMKQFDIKYTAAGENIAKGQKTPASVMSGWMNSSGHRANILSSKYGQIGVGYVTDSKGNTYWVQMFIN